jgi:FkbM family methyltransferase
MASILSKITTDVGNRWKNLFNQDLKKADLNWFKVRSLKYARTNTEHTFQLKGGTIHYRNGLELLHSLIEIFVDEIYKMNLESSTPYILDCGANMGLSVLYLKQRHPHATVIAFEPDDQNFELLQRNAGDLEGVRLEKAAVWKESGTIQFVSTGTLSSKIVNAPGNQSHSINAVRLRDFIDREVDFLKLDIEGAEFEVLKDCADKLFMIQNLFIEYHGNFDQEHELIEILQLLTRNSYKYYIREATECYPTPFFREFKQTEYDVQLNIFCFKIKDGVK